MIVLKISNFSLNGKHVSRQRFLYERYLKVEIHQGYVRLI